MREYNKEFTYLLACSFGPDSMALFDMLFKDGYKFVVCHVNYHKRSVSNFEEKSLRKYCQERKIPFEVLDTNGLTHKGNFQAWAREVRYDFFSKCYTKYNAKGLFIAHNQDDLLETYLMQIKRNAYVSYYGIKEEISFKNMRVLRPLLGIKKADLQKYDDEHNIPYSIDESNLTDCYTRNKIRHSIVQNLDDAERNKLLEEIENKNQNIEKTCEKISSFISNEKIDINVLHNFNDYEFATALHLLRNKYSVLPFSHQEISSIKKTLTSGKSNIEIKLKNNVFLWIEYGELQVGKYWPNYSYVLAKPGKYSCPEFDIDFTDAKDRNINLDSYPISIRNATKDDMYCINNYSVSIRRLFIDWKMPKHLRSSWPVILNSKQEIIYIPRYRKVFKDEHKSTFKIKII